MVSCDSVPLLFSRRFPEDDEQEQCQGNDHPTISVGFTVKVVCLEITLRFQDRIGKAETQRQGTRGVTRERRSGFPASKKSAVISQSAYPVSTPFYG
jgi:hypothetical protein